MEENLRRSLLLSDGSWSNFCGIRTLTACILDYNDFDSALAYLSKHFLRKTNS
jgi:hypothetical protein